MLGTEPFKRRQDQFMLKGEDQPENIDGRRELKRRDGGDKYENESKISKDSWFVSNELSDGLVLFTSDEGRKVFFESAHSGYLNSYFELAQNFLTSIEPRYSCSLATVTMCLNTFREDPRRIWKDNYRWYSQTMLEHCIPYKIIEGNGVVFQQFACMAEANNLKVALVRNLKPTATIDEFRAICKRTTSGSCDEILIVCYHRNGLDQEGSGHYSSIGGYHPEKDLVLVFDISRYKYPLHWVPVKRLWEAMAMHDDVTGNPRGYFVLTKRTHLDKPSYLFKTVNPEDSPSFHEGWLKFFETALLPWHNWMKISSDQSVNASVMLGFVVKTLFRFMTSSQCSGIDHLAGIHVRLEFKDADSSYGKKCLVCDVREAIESSILWKFVVQQIVGKEKQEEELKEGDEQTQEQPVCLCWSKLIDEVTRYQQLQSSKMCCDMKIQPSVCHLQRFNLAHYITMILLSWPYDLNETNGHRTKTRICIAMKDIVSTESSSMSKVLREEVANCRRRFQKARFAIQ